MRKLASTLGAVALAFSALGAQAQNLVGNGDFSAGGAGWGNIDGVFTSFAGVAFIGANDGIYQSISLDWNTQYLLTFSTIGTGSVSLINLPFALSSTPSGTGQASWNFSDGAQSFYFNTGAPSQAYAYTQLRLLAGAGQSFAVDNVSVTAVPEPETYAMMLAGLGAIGLMARRRKAQA